MSGRDIFTREALAQIPKILTLLDRNPHSPTFGCFDRNYWHYKIIDFPSGMAQEFVWPLALAAHAPAPGNPFHGQPAVRDWVEAGIRFAAQSAHADGSCDDYFPFEKAGGAAAFSLLACAESYKLMDLKAPDLLAFFERRVRWLAGHHESGRLANHQALIALCLEIVGRMLATEEWNGAIDERIRVILGWQDGEGWFAEYEGCDPGYHTLTIGCLAWLLELRPSEELREAVRRAVNLAIELAHPDGTFGGEYGSRNTYNFFPHGFELAGRWMPEALALNDRYAAGLAAGLGPCHADDHILGHHTWNYLLAARDWNPQRPEPAPRPEGRVWFRNAGILVDRREGAELFVALNKGGVFKLFRGGRLFASDTQISLAVREGRRVRNAVGHLVDAYETEVAAGEVRVRGTLGWAKQKKMTPFAMLALRVVMLAGGRFFPDLIRKLLQKMLITGKQPAPFRFERVFRWKEGGGIEVEDKVEAGSWENVESAGIGGDQTSIYVVMSRTFQAGQLQPWFNLTGEIAKLRPGEPLALKRTV